MSQSSHHYENEKNPSKNGAACVICLDTQLKDPTILDVCQHFFCYECIYQWLIENPSCPLCKKHPLNIKHHLDPVPQTFPVAYNSFNGTERNVNEFVAAANPPMHRNYIFIDEDIDENDAAAIFDDDGFFINDDDTPIFVSEQNSGDEENDYVPSMFMNPALSFQGLTRHDSLQYARNRMQPRQARRISDINRRPSFRGMMSPMNIFGMHRMMASMSANAPSTHAESHGSDEEVEHLETSVLNDSDVEIINLTESGDSDEEIEIEPSYLGNDLFEAVIQDSDVDIFSEESEVEVVAYIPHYDIITISDSDESEESDDDIEIISSAPNRFIWEDDLD